LSEFISPNVQTIPTYLLTKIWDVEREMRAKGIDIIDLATGVPEVDPPDHVIQATVQAVKEHMALSPPQGLLELRQAITERLRDDDGSEVDESEILITPGSKAALFVSIVSSIEKDDEVLMPSPFFHPYLQITSFAGGKLIKVPCFADGSFRLRREDLETRITKKTRLVILNYPNNPAGWTLTKDGLKAILELAQEHDLLVLTDEIYCKIVFDGLRHFHSTYFRDLRDRIMMTGGFSKTYAMPHYRLGYAVANKKRVDQMKKLLLAMITMPNTFVQKAGVAALKGQQDFVNKRLEVYEKRRDLAVERLNKIEGVRCSRPQGAFFVFPDLSLLRMPSVELAERLIREEHVSTVPGVGSGEEWDGYLKISLTDTDDRLAEALGRIHRFVQKYRRS